jgi:hypothetical protein
VKVEEKILNTKTLFGKKRKKKRITRRMRFI